MSGFDISQQVDASRVEDEGTLVHIHGIDEIPLFYKDEDGNEQPVGIEVAGEHSAIHRKVQAELRRRKIRPKDLTGQRMHEDTIERVARCTIRWQGFFDNEKPVPFTVDNARTLYKRCPWVMDQVLEAMTDHSRFFKKESNS